MLDIGARTSSQAVFVISIIKTRIMCSKARFQCTHQQYEIDMFRALPGRCSVAKCRVAAAKMTWGIGTEAGPHKPVRRKATMPLLRGYSPGNT